MYAAANSSQTQCQERRPVACAISCTASAAQPLTFVLDFGVSAAHSCIGRIYPLAVVAAPGPYSKAYLAKSQFGDKTICHVSRFFPCLLSDCFSQSPCLLPPLRWELASPA